MSVPIRVRILAASVIVAVMWVGTCLAQTNLMPGVTWGPSTAFTTFQRDATGDWTGGLQAAGIGPAIKFYPGVFKNPERTLSYMGFEVPFYLSIVEQVTELRVGGMINFFNGLVGVGVDVTAMNTATDRGVFLGDVRTEDVRILLVWGFNLTAGTPSYAARTAGEGAPRKPFNCFGN